MTIKEDWRVSLSAKTKHGGFTIKSKDAKSPLDAWRVANARFINRHGTHTLPHLLFGGLKSITKIKPKEKKTSVKEEYKSLAHEIHNVLGENIGRSGKSSLTRSLHSSGARRHQISKGIQPISKLPRKKRGGKGLSYIKKTKNVLKEVVASDRGQERPVTKYDPQKNKYIIVSYNERRKTINLTGDTKIPKKSGGYHPYVNPMTGLPFGN